jgi:predicted RNA-binding protein YlqC (UPF0109 family)
MTLTPATVSVSELQVLAETVTVRAICQGKHAGSIIGKGGQTISWIRQQSQAKVNISDQSPVDERCVHRRRAIPCRDGRACAQWLGVPELPHTYAHGCVSKWRLPTRLLISHHRAIAE